MPEIDKTDGWFYHLVVILKEIPSCDRQHQNGTSAKS